ncbi:MAG: hypothetical protein RIQ93_2510 [Verrucomicrobiota bacterium]|jgi:hypothetical protein
MNKAAASATFPGESLKRRHLRSQRPITFRAFIAYADVAAAGQVMNAINQVCRAAKRKHVLKPMLWRFNQLASPQWRDRAVEDAAEADIIIFASTPATTFPVALEEWTSFVLERRRGQSTTLVALLGPGDTWTITLEQPRDPTSPMRQSEPRDLRCVA